MPRAFRKAGYGRPRRRRQQRLASASVRGRRQGVRCRPTDRTARAWGRRRPRGSQARELISDVSSGPGARTHATGHNLAVRYCFDDSVLDTTRYELSRGGELVHVEPQVFDVLAHLVEHRDRVVAKTELLEVVWGHLFVSESALTTRVKQLRQAVGDSGREQRIVQTVHGRGYRFVAPVDEVADHIQRVPLPIPSDLRQEIRFCTTPDGTRLAYATD